MLETLTIDFLRRQMYFLVQKIFHCHGKKKEAFKREKKSKTFCCCCQMEAARSKKETSQGLEMFFSRSPGHTVHQLDDAFIQSAWLSCLLQ